MSARGNSKKPPGNSNRGKGNNRGKSQQPSTSSKSEEWEFVPKNLGQGRGQPQPANRGKKNTNRNVQTNEVQQKNEPPQGAFPFPQNFSSFMSSISAGFQASSSQMGNTNLAQISLNFQTSNFSASNPSFQPSGNAPKPFQPRGNAQNPSFQPRGNAQNPSFQPRGNAQNPSFQPRGNAPRGRSPNVQQPIRLPPKKKEAPTEIRIFDGNREANTPKTNFRHPSPNPRAHVVHQLRPRGAHSAGSHRPHFPVPPQAQNRQQQYNNNQQKPHNFNRQSSCPQGNSPNNQTQTPFFFNTSQKQNPPDNQRKSNNKNTPQPPMNIQCAPAKAPVFKFTKKQKPKVADKQLNLNNNRQAPQAKTEKPLKVEGQRSQNQRKRTRRSDLWKKKKAPTEVAPLFSFQRVSKETESIQKESVSDDEDATTISRCSSEESIWTTNISDDGVEDSVSDESEVASEVASEVSLSSSIKGSMVSEDWVVVNSASSFSSKVDGFISVFWDIENCPVPKEKSAVDFVKRIRTTFYEGRKEANFFVVCDVTNLSKILADELHLSNTTVIHMSSVNKNAADSKISSLLLDFRDSYKGNNSAIVLISGDSDFSTILNNLQYKFHVYINLVCRANARHTLTAAAQRCIFYEEFVKDLPSRAKNDCLEYLLIVSYSKSVAQKKVKNVISERLKGVNCRVTRNDNFSIAVVFQDQCARDRASSLLAGFVIEEKEIEICSSERKKETEQSESKQKRKAQGKEIPDIRENLILSEKQNKNDEEDVKENSTKAKKSKKLGEAENNKAANSKSATLWVCVSKQFGDIDYWKVKLTDLWKTSEFELQWEGNSTQGMFLVNFKSLSEAKKYQKILQKLQKTDPKCPKFMKLIKQDKISNELFTVVKSIEDINKRKIEEHIHIIETKKEACLSKHEETFKALKKAPTPAIPGAAEAKMSKLNELNEQKITFLSFTQVMLDKVKKVDFESEFIDDILALYLRDYSRECNCLTLALPIYAKKNLILKTIKKHQVVIIKAETGSGKSTQLTQYIWREDLSQKGLVVCTQPRKIAAITLAKHVSSQVGYSLGEVVGYQVGLNVKKSENTAILYVTDFTMLKMIVSNDLKNVSCIIVDEAHERTVYTDLLLGMIKSCLKVKPDLKLIITSATIDTSIFKDYFGIGDYAVLEVSGRTFPVEDVWMEKSVALGWDYFQTTVDTVYDILNQEPGDVLAFLTTPFETEKAVKVLSEKLGGKMGKNIRIHQLHGKLAVEEQQKIFERTPSDVRKVVFATNCAETSVTIPGIRYVVDCGMVKESQYDAVRNMNVLSVNFVSQSSAEQRRGRAGRTQVGKCYRLYSKTNYESMVKTSVPEILRVNLGQALLRLMKIGIKNPLQFDFVQSPEEKCLTLTMKQLINLNAVSRDDLSLTELGEKMSCLPIEPRLSFLVLTGIDLNVGFEAVVLAALVTVSRNIFFRTAENKSDADVKKMRFCQSESDFLTYFEVYKEWAGVPKQAKSQWCTLNCINARSLRTAQELVFELMTILAKEMKIKVASKFSDNSVNDTLLELVFRSFYQNLCIFSGYHRFGYRSGDVPGDLIIHPSSSLYTYGHWRPQFLVYDTILSTNQTYLINVSPMAEDDILRCMDTYGLEIDLEALKSLQLTTYGISPLGLNILFQDIIGKRGTKKKLLESQLKKKIGSDQLAVEVDAQKGEVKVYGPHSRYEEIASILCPLIEKGQERLAEEEKEVFIYPELCAIASAGIVIRDVIMPGEFKDVKVTLNTDVEITSVVEKLQTVGPVSTVREWKNYYKVTFLSPVHAKLAIKEFKNETSFTLQKIFKGNALNGGINQYKVFVSFPRRECTGIAFVTIDPPSSLPDVVAAMNLNAIYYQNRLLKCSISKKSQDLVFNGLSADPDRKEFEKLLSSYLPSGSKISKCVIVRKKEYESIPSEIDSIKQKIIDAFAEFTSKDRFSVDLKTPKSKDFSWNAWVFFENACRGETAVKILKSRTNSSFLNLELKPSLQTSLYCKLEVYFAIKTQVEEALKFYQDNSVPGNTLEIEGYPKEDGYIQIRLTSNNIPDMSDARKTILNLMLGDQIVCEGNVMMEKLFGATGQAHLKNLSRENCYIDLNTYKKVITIFGDVSASNFVKLEINKFLDLLEKEHFEEINLMPESGRPGVLRLLLIKYGHGLKALMEECDLTNIEVDSRQHILAVRGSDSAVSKCQDIIKDLKEKLEENEYAEDTEFCPVCFDKVSDQLHRLEYCGHAYCKECTLHWFQNASDFPLNCITCEAAVVLADIQWATKEVKSFETEVFKKALIAFVQSRNDISYCPSPDCPMIFRISNDGTIFDCPSCNNSICTQCQEVYHFGMSCSLYQCVQDNDYSLKMWMEEDPEGRKMCPTCSSPIEKDGGCNHMTCWKCQCHMCWLCLKVFSTGDLVYDHQPFCPKLTKV